MLRVCLDPLRCIGFRLAEAGFRSVPTDDAIIDRAIKAFAAFGKGRRRTARLNFADCIVYATAITANAPLLFVGNDFSQTDIASVLDDPGPLSA
jgi:ribonuclease VapC